MQENPGVDFRQMAAKESASLVDGIYDEYAKQRTTPFKQGFVNYATPSTNKPTPSFLRPTSDLMLLDPDPTGEKTASWAKAGNLGFNNDHVEGLNVFGKVFTKDELEQTDYGTKLLNLAIKNRQGKKRGFWEAFTDFEWADAPFLSLFASVGGSIRDAALVSGTFEKLHKGEQVTDEELLKTRLYMAEQERRSAGGIGSMVGDIVRQAPGFMIEFATTGFLYSGLRTLAAKAASKSASGLATLQVNRAVKTMAHEFAEQLIKEKALTTAGTDATTSVLRSTVAKLGGNAKVKEGMVDTLAKALTAGVKESGVAEDMAGAVAKNLAKNAIERQIAQQGASNAFMQFARGTGAYIKDAAARGLLDFGRFGTSSSTVATTSYSTAGRALKDALATMTVGAVTEGSLMALPKFALIRPAVGLAAQSKVHSQSELMLRQSALMQGNDRLMADAESIASGIDLLEYISESTGGAFSAITKGLGILTKLSKPGQQVLKLTEKGLIEEAKHAEVGGFFRKMARKRFGTAAEQAAKSVEQRQTHALNALNQRLEAAGANRVTAAAYAEAAGAKDASRLGSAAASIIGGDFDKFERAAVKQAVFENPAKMQAYKDYARFVLADQMARHNWGPDQIMNAFERAGYDGILGEMFEERYSDFAKGLLGLDDRATHDFLSNAKTAITNLYPGFDQLVAEAVGFALPMAERSALAYAQSRITGGDSHIKKLRATAQSLASYFNSTLAAQVDYGTVHKQATENAEAARKQQHDEQTGYIKDAYRMARGEEANDETIASIRDGLVDENAVMTEDQLPTVLSRITELTGHEFSEDEKASLEHYVQRSAEFRKKSERQVKWLKDIRSANNIEVEVEDLAEANAKMIWVPVVDMGKEAGDFRTDKANVTQSNEQIASTYGAMQFAQDNIVDLALAIYEAGSQGDVGESVWRQYAGKAMGLAAMVLCGDTSLAHRNYAGWLSVDEGLSPNLVRSIYDTVHTLHDDAVRQLREEAISQAPEKGAARESGATYSFTEDQIRAKMNENNRLRDTMMEYLRIHAAVRGVRFLSNNQIAEQALELTAKLKDFAHDDATDTYVSGDARFTRDEFARKFAGEIEAKRKEVAKKTLEILTADNGTSLGFVDGVIGQIVTHKFNSSSEEDHFLTAAALRLAADRNHTVIRSVIEEGREIADTLEYGSLSVKKSSLMDLAAKTTVNGRPFYDVTDESTNRLVAELAADLRKDRIHGSDEEIKQMHREVIDFAHMYRFLAQELGATDTQDFTCQLNAEEADPRIYDSATYTVTAHKTRDGWSVTFDPEFMSAAEGGAKPVTITRPTLDQLRQELEHLDRPFLMTESRIVLTDVEQLQTNDPILLLRKFGLVPAYLRLTQGRVDATHPAFQKDANGKYVHETRDSWERVHQENMRMAVFFAQHGMESGDPAAYDRFLLAEDRGKVGAREAKMEEYRTVYFNTLGDNGYMTLVNQVLQSANVQGDVTNQDVLNTYINGATPLYQMPVTQFNSIGRAKSRAKGFIPVSTTVVPVNFGHMQDYSDAFARSHILRVLQRGARFIRNPESGVRRALVDMLKCVSDHIDAELTRTDLPKDLRASLSSLKANMMRDTNRPQLRDLAEMIHAVAFFSAERAKDLNASTNLFTSAWAAIAPRARQDSRFIPFLGAVDILFGGDCFGILQTAKSLGQSVENLPLRGVARAFSMYCGNAGASVTDALQSLRKVAGYEDTSAFLNEFARAARAVGIERVRPTGQAKQQNDTESRSFSSFVTRLWKDYKFENLDQFVAVFDAMDTRNVTGEARDALTGLRHAYATQLAQVKEELAQAKASVEKAQQDLQAAKDKAVLTEREKNELKERLKTALEVQRHAQDNVNSAEAALSNTNQNGVSKENRAVVGGGESAHRNATSAGTTPRPGNSKNKKPGKNGKSVGPGIKVQQNNGSEKKTRLDFIVDQSIDLNPVIIADSEDGISVSQGFDVVSDFANGNTSEDRETRRCGISIILAHAHNSLGTSWNVTKEEFVSSARELFGHNILDVELDRLWQDYDKVDAEHKNAFSYLDTSDSSREVQDDNHEDEGVDSSNDNYGADKAVKAFDNKALNNFLTYAALVNPATGRELGALCNALRSTVDNALSQLPRDAAGEVVPSTEAKAFQALHWMLNPRSMPATMGRTASERASTFDAMVDNIIEGANGLSLDTLIGVMSAKNQYGFARSRLGAFMFSYLSVLGSSARRNMMGLISYTAACSTSTVKEVTNPAAADPKTADSVLCMYNENTRYSLTSERTITSSFLPFVGKSSEQIREVAAQIRKEFQSPEIVARIKQVANSHSLVGVLDEALANGKNEAKAQSAKLVLSAVAVPLRYNAQIVADVLAKYFGHESPVVQALRGREIYDHMYRSAAFAPDLDPTKGDLDTLGTFRSRDLARMYQYVSPSYRGNSVTIPGAVTDLLNILDTLAGLKNRDAEAVSRTVVALMETGLDTSAEGFLAPHKQARADTQWMRIFSMYNATLPQTLADANHIPSRSNKAASTIAVSARSVAPLLQQWLDKPVTEVGSFAWLCWNQLEYKSDQFFKPRSQQEIDADTQARRAKGDTSAVPSLRPITREEFVAEVLPWCRQHMCWPDMFHTPLFTKCRDVDLNGEEIYSACENTFKYLFTVGNDQILRGTDSWAVPVYKGDHANGVIMRIPIMSDPTLFHETAADYKAAANRVARFIGMKVLGHDTKRATVTSSEAPGTALFGTQLAADGTVAKRGKNYVHMLYNYELGGVDDAFLGSIFTEGYGMQVQAKLATDPSTDTFKVHYNSVDGVDVVFNKGLTIVTSPGKDRKVYAQGSAHGWVFNHLDKYMGTKETPDLDNHVVVDGDSVKLGILNSKNLGVLSIDNKGKPTTMPLYKYIFDRMKGQEAGKSFNLASLNELLADGTQDDGKFWFVFGYEEDRSIAGLDASGTPIIDPKTGKPTSKNLVRVSIDQLLGNPVYDDNGVAVMDDTTGRQKLDGTDIEIVPVDTGRKDENGQPIKVFDLVYVNNSIMAHAVANVSHPSTPQIGRSARNNVVDVLTMGVMQSHSGMMKRTDTTAADLMNLIADYSVLTASMVADSTFIDHVAKDSKSIRELLDAGEAVGGVNYNSKLAYDVFSRLTKALGVPLYKVDSALQSCGAKYMEDENDGWGGIVDHTSSPALRYLNRGSVCIARNRRAQFNGLSRRFAACRVNVRDAGFRYAWLVKTDAVDSVLKAVFGAEEFDSNGTPVRSDVPYHGTLTEKIEALVTEIHKADLDHYAAREAYYASEEGSPEEERLDKALTDAKTKARKFRTALATMFQDHHGEDMSARADDYIFTVGFDDLFCKDPSDPRKTIFDRTAVYEGPDAVPCDTDIFPAEKPGQATRAVLMGSTFHTPRTPSYNGHMFLQVMRASIPAAEEQVIVDGGVKYEVQYSAAVIPDAQTEKIEGCDNDGDKAQVSFFSIDTDPEIGTGLALDIDISDGAVKDKNYAKDGDARRQFLERMRTRGVLDFDADNSENGGTYVFAEGEAYKDALGYSRTYGTRDRISNAYYRGIVELARNLPTNRLDKTSEEDLAYMNDNDYDFYRCTLARATKTTPVNDGDMKRLKELADKSKMALLGTDLANVEAASRAVTSAGKADKARGMIVSIALTLHLAKLSGKFERGSNNGTLFVMENASDWFDFIYGIDGMSNATFDDIKEQICAQLGWDPGMMETIVVDLLTRGEKAPRTSQEFLEILSTYLTDIVNKGANYYALVAGDPSRSAANDSVHDAINSFFTGKTNKDHSLTIYRDQARSKMCLKVDFDSGKYMVDESRLASAGDGVRLFIRQIEFLVNAGAHGGGFTPSGKPHKLGHLHQVLSRLAADITLRKGANPGAGMIYHAISTARDEATAKALALRYLKWSDGTHIFNTARKFGNSFFFLKADPGNGSKMAQREAAVQVFNDVLNNVTPTNEMEVTVDGALTRMFAATQTAYNLGNLQSTYGRMGLAASLREEALVTMASALNNKGQQYPWLRSAVGKLITMQAVSPNDLLKLEANLQMLPFTLAMLQTMPACAGTDVMSGEGGEAAVRTLGTIADAVHPFTGGQPRTVNALEGIISMFNTMYALAATDANLMLRNPAFAYFSQRGNLASGRESGLQLRSLNATFRQKDVVAARRATHYIQQMADGTFDRYVRVPTHKFSSGATVNSLRLSLANMDMLLGSETNPAVEGKLDPRLRKDVEITRAILAALSKDKPGVEITPSMMFSQFLPLYTVMTSRTTGAPSPASASLMGLFPNLFQKLSLQQAKYDTGILDIDGQRRGTGMSLMDVLCSSVWDFLNVRASDISSFARGRKADYKTFDKDKYSASTQAALLNNAAQLDPSEDIPEGTDLRRAPALNPIVSTLIGSTDAVYRNPEGMNALDILGHGDVFTDILRHVNSVSAEDAVGTPEETQTTAPAGATEAIEETDDDVKNLVQKLQVVLGTFATVEYTGGKGFIIRSKAGGLPGLGSARFGGARGTGAVIQVHVGQPEQGQNRLTVDVNNPNIATSFCAASRKYLGITPWAFMNGLTPDERRALIARFTSANTNLTNFSLSRPSFSFDGNGMAILAGAININSAKELGSFFHEYGHTMISFARAMDLFSEEDIKFFVRKFGKATEGVDELFNEERMVEDFRKWAEKKFSFAPTSKDRKAGEKATDDLLADSPEQAKDNAIKESIFSRIWNVITSFFKALQAHFSYESDGAERLYGMFITGYTGLSDSKLQEIWMKKSGEVPQNYTDRERLVELQRYFADSAMFERTYTRDSAFQDFDLKPVDNAEADAVTRLWASARIEHPQAADWFEENFSAQDAAYHNALIKELHVTEMGDFTFVERSAKTSLPAVAQLVNSLVRARTGRDMTDEGTAEVAPDMLGDVKFMLGAQESEPHVGARGLFTQGANMNTRRHQLEELRSFISADALASFTEEDREFIAGLAAKEDSNVAWTEDEVKQFNDLMASRVGGSFETREADDLISASSLKTAFDEGFEPQRRDAIYGKMQNILMTAVNSGSIAAQISPDAKVILAGIETKKTFSERLLELSRLSADARAELTRMQAMAKLGAERYRTITGDKFADPNILYRALLHTAHSAKQLATRAVTNKSHAFYRAATSGFTGDENTQMKTTGFMGTVDGKLRLSSADFTGALLAMSAHSPMKVIDGLRARIHGVMAQYAGSEHVAEVCRKLLRDIDQFGAVDITQVLSDPAAWQERCNTISRSIFAGLRRGSWDYEKGQYRDYYEAAEDTSDVAADNKKLYQLGDGSQLADAGDNPVVQRLLNDCADVIFSVFAAMKYYNEAGIHSGTFQESAFRGVRAPANVPVADIFNEFGIGAAQMSGPYGLIDIINKPEFVLNNFESWYAAQLPRALGDTDVRQLFMNKAKTFRAQLAVMTNTENVEAMYFGISRLEGSKLYKIIEREGKFAFESGFYRVTDPDKRGKVIGFDARSGISGKNTDVSFTDDEYRTVDLFMKSLAVRANGGRYMVTGLDRVSFETSVALDNQANFNGGFSENPEDYTPEKVAEAVAKYERESLEGNAQNRAIPGFMIMLANLVKQWHLGVTESYEFVDENGVTRTAGMKFYNRLVESICKGIATANMIANYQDKDLLRNVKANELGRDMTAADYNDIILAQLESDRLVICQRQETPVNSDVTRRSYTDGKFLRKSGVIVFDTRELERAFKRSSAYNKLIQAGRDPARLDGDATIKRYMTPYRAAIKEISKYPWLTKGDGSFFHNFGTPLPFAEGAGTFMYRMNRASRDFTVSEKIRLGRHEGTFLNMLANPKLALQNVQTATTNQLMMVRDYYELEELTADELRNAILNGKYAAGSRASMNTGLELDTDSTIMDVARAVYRKQLDRHMSRLEGKTYENAIDSDDAIARMIKGFEDATGEGEGTLVGGLGMTDEDMYRKFGALPKNFQIGHKIHTTLQGITNALQFRTTLINMLSIRRDGKPVCFAKPFEHAVESGGIPDNVWGYIARSWAKAIPSLKYDPALTGVQNARAMYDAILELRSNSDVNKQFRDLARDEIDSRSIETFMTWDGGESDYSDPNESKLNKINGHNPFRLDGNEVLGYARHLFQSSRVLGGNAVAQRLQHVYAWSKSVSVAFSWFFPWATRWESPTAAVGIAATLGSNLSPEFVRKHHDAINLLQKVGTLGFSDGWTDENFIGFKDIVDMMDSDDPFLADLYTWAEALGITMTDRLSNPMEPNKGLVAKDIQTMVDRVRATMGSAAARRCNDVLTALLTRSGEKAFTYALNATKLAVTCQIAMKLKSEAMKQGKAFDPIRDLAKYSTYVDSEIGGVNPLRYAWAHPAMRRALNWLYFSWEWTRTAWEAGGGGVIEDALFGGHTFTKQERKYLAGRWLRMYGTMMVGLPMMIQMLAVALSKAMGAGDDDDKWFTWQNEDKTAWTAADITPLLRALGNQDSVIGRFVRGVKESEITAGAGMTAGLVGGALAGAAAGAGFGRGGAVLGALAGAMTGGKMGRGIGNLIPAYTGMDEANSSGTRSRRYYFHVGKQGWEFPRWFTDPSGQFFSKLSMPNQRMLEGLIGRNLSFLDRELNMGETFAERWNPLSPTSAWVNMAKSFVPFSVSGVSTFGDAGIIAAFGPVQMGESQTGIQKRVKTAMRYYAENDRRAYAFGVKHGHLSQARSMVLADVLVDARRNGHDATMLQNRAIGQLAGEYYGRLFKSLPKHANDDFDVKEVERCIRALHRLGIKWDSLVKSVKTRSEGLHGTDWAKISPEDRKFMMDLVKTVWHDPHGVRRIDY